MEEREFSWGKIYLGLMASLLVMIAMLYWLTVAFA